MDHQDMQNSDKKLASTSDAVNPSTGEIIREELREFLRLTQVSHHYHDGRYAYVNRIEQLADGSMRACNFAADWISALRRRSELSNVPREASNARYRLSNLRKAVDLKNAEMRANHGR